MNVLVSDLTNLISKYEKCLEMANYFGRVIILKDEHPDSVLLPIAEYTRLTKASKKSNKLNKTDIVDLVKQLPTAGNREVYTLAQLKHDLYHSNEIVYR